MNLIDEQLNKIKASGKIGLMTHVIVGYPNLNATVEIVKAMADAGADFIELQIPFSDPIADGPTIMKACEKSLKNGTKIKDAIAIMEDLSSQVSIPLLFMGYYNNIFKYGPKQFCQDAKKAGASGVIIPDMPLEEEDEEHFLQYCSENDLYNIRVVSPASTDERLLKNAKVAQGFVYCTARQGTTGTRSELDPTLASYLERVKRICNLPTAVGFGISQKKHLQALKNHADIAVIGSALVEITNQASPNSLRKDITTFISSLQTNRS